VAAVAKGRGVAQGAVREGYGEGTVLTAKRALGAGLVDRVDTFDGTLARLAAGKVVMRGAKAIEPPAGIPVLGPIDDRESVTDPVEAALADSAAAERKRSAELALARVRR
jgi:ClpP class serine protease